MRGGGGAPWHGWGGVGAARGRGRRVGRGVETADFFITREKDRGEACFPSVSRPAEGAGGVPGRSSPFLAAPLGLLLGLVPMWRVNKAPSLHFSGFR